MKKIVIFGCQQIAVDFIRHVEIQSDVEISLVVTYELPLDKTYGYESVIENFASSLAKNQPPMTPGWSALRSHALIDAMETANRSGQRVEVSLCH